MAGTFLTSEREKIYQEDTQGGASVSESYAGKIGSSINFILDRIVQQLQFGVTGNYFSALSTPYTFSESSEIIAESYLIQRVRVSLELSGTSGNTEFRLEKRLAGAGTWNTMFSVNCVIANTAADALSFTSDGGAVTGVTLPVLSITTLAAGDEVRLVLVSAAGSARNLIATLDVSPV